MKREIGNAASLLGPAEAGGGLISQMSEMRSNAVNPMCMLTSHTYDQGGNRKVKTDLLNQRQIKYHYDTDTVLTDIDGNGQLENPRTYYGTRNNRLMYYDVFDTSTLPELPRLVETVYYEYRADQAAQGNPTFIVRKVYGPTSGTAMFYGNALKYNQQGELWFVTQIHWSETDPACNELVRERILEFRGSGRARYLTRQRDPTVENGQSREQVVLPGTTRWSDYDGDTIYGDYVVDPETGSVVNQTAYLPGIGQMDNVSGAVTYYHADHLGTLRATTDGAGAFAGAMAYTAFGEMVAADGSIGGEGLSSSPVGSRYQYAGDWGYESGLLPAVDGGSGNSIPGLSWQHVGHRWYDPSTGRFLQRDPIGIRGGLNVYEYVGSEPSEDVDPSGLDRWIEGTVHLCRLRQFLYGLLENRNGHVCS